MLAVFVGAPIAVSVASGLGYRSGYKAGHAAWLHNAAADGLIGSPAPEETVPEAAPIDHDAIHDALRIIDTLKTALFKEHGQRGYCPAAWSKLCHIQRYLEGCCKRDVDDSVRA